MTERAHRVSVSMGYTRNMGDFESLRMDVGLEADGTGDPNVTFTRVKNWVQTKMLENFREVEDQLRTEKKKRK